ncbi:MAG: hypothetical protein RLZ98_2979 [Pseudomonadota bacterium]|jgi:MazG family protein
MTKPDSGNPVAQLIEVMAQLRNPDGGCPWDLEQDFETIAPYTIEEAYEVADAIARGDLADLKEELGDLLLQVVYHARMAEEREAFRFEDVARGIVAKMIRRHPHVFGTEEERALGATPGFWERIKAEERAEKAATRQALGLDDAVRQKGHLGDISLALPALSRAVKLQARAAQVGFDWPSLQPVFDKMREELGEFEAAIADSDSGNVEEEFGDLLFVMANVARHLKIDPEDSLRAANAKFVRRFAYIEERLAAEGRLPDQSSLEEMDLLWDEAKSKERKG